MIRCSKLVRLAIAFVVSLSSMAAARGADSSSEELFVRRIGPLLNQKCVACHGASPDEIEGGLDLRSAEGLHSGGDSGEAAVVPGEPANSPLFLAVVGDHDLWSPMPPKESEKLNAEQVQWVRQWIAGGAVWPDQSRMIELADANAEQWSVEDGIVAPTSGGQSPEWTQRRYKPESLWGYQDVVKPDIAETGSDAIDRLVHEQMPSGLHPAPLADRKTLIRRATFDLTGLPPAPEDVAAYLTDPLPEDIAFAKVVDRLLESPHYGERMAQHWLDVVRYADSSGFANDYERGNAWRYRDYVVRAFNIDKPYDQFIREQIAGDEIDPENPEMLVATGFLRAGPWELTGMEVAKVARQRFLDDMTNSVGETFLAHSLQCARCHDHKFDPVPTGDYYAIQAVFATTQLSERPAAFLDRENTGGFEEKHYLHRRRDEYQTELQRLDRKLLKSAQQWFAEHAIDPADWNEAVQVTQKKKADGVGSVFSAARTLMMRKGVPEDQYPPKLYGFSPQDYGNERVARKGLERLEWELDRYEPYALAVHSGRTPQVSNVKSPVRMPADRMTKGELEQTCVLIGGDPFASGEPVQPGVLSTLGNGQRFPITGDIEGRRKEFADWVARPDNPLTTRTIVNRLWLWHFNQPIAGNPNNFGSTGKPPTHPQLLDWLAATLVEQEWSVKSLHRIIMNSQVYRRSGKHPDPLTLQELDPLETSYAVFKPRRLSAEEIRDSMLAVTGEWNPAIGGIPNRPEINLEAALQPRQVMGTFAAAWIPNPLPEQRHRRSLYALKLRGLTDPMLEVFNLPSPDFSCEMRDSSSVTPQVFSLFNGQATHARALALANRVLKEANSDEAAINRCFELSFSRRPSTAELDLCLAHWQEIVPLVQDAPPRDSVPLLIRREAVEENTGEKFSFYEQLHANADFVHDLQPADVDPRTRALADVCVTLFNTNEFVYVY
jgi:mono/diheme cytochrome c family protein